MISPRISEERLLRGLAELAAFGGRPDGGVDRVAGSEADLTARAWIEDRLSSWGLEAWTDETGNVFGRDPQAGPARLLIGSHSDTVPAGGRLDGAYGVVAAMEVLRTLHELGHPAAAGTEVVSFWDEEGVQPESAGGLVGSTALAASPHIEEIAGFVELHIEQGPRLEQRAQDVCVVDGIVGIERHMITVTGEPNHAGTTPFDLRRDAGRTLFLAASQVTGAVRAVSRAAVCNIGWVALEPGAPNVIPGTARMVVEIRAPSERDLRRCVDRVVGAACRIAGEQRCAAHHRRLSRKPVVGFDPGMRELLGQACQAATGRPGDSLFSYAGHDAGAVSAQVPTAMLFVPSKDGISHSPKEFTPDHLLVTGAQALMNAVVLYHQRHQG